jgi:hypothetical protein
MSQERPRKFRLNSRVVDLQPTASTAVATLQGTQGGGRARSPVRLTPNLSSSLLKNPLATEEA